MQVLYRPKEQLKTNQQPQRNCPQGRDLGLGRRGTDRAAAHYWVTEVIHSE